jgi:dipeptidase
MWSRLLATIAAALLALGFRSDQSTGVSACTVIAVGKDATADGSTLVAHTDDAGGGAADLRLVRVPAMDHPSGSQRAVYNFFSGYPRLVTTERGPHYEPVSPLADDASPPPPPPLSEPMGYIPQIPRTFAYFDQDYGMMNEVQLSIGESTCGAKTVGWALDAGPHGKNLFGIAELTKVALERCETARCAIITMGDLATEYGFYSEDSGDVSAPDFGDSAEALAIADKHGELWVFHILTGANNTGAVWAAQRVRDDHVTAIANGFTIREMDLSNPDWFLASDNVESFAIEMGWFEPEKGKPFDFTKSYGFAEKDAVGPLYTGRRIWRVLDVFAPSLKLDSRLGSFSEYATYPFSVHPEAKAGVTLQHIMELLGDHYEGTPYDMTKGVAAGPFGAPIRWSGTSRGIVGGWERPISMYRTVFSFVLQARGHLPDAVGGIAWYGQDQPHGTVYVPFSCAHERVPSSYLVGKQSEFHARSAWWAFNFVNNWSLLRFNVINADIKQEARKLQLEAFESRANAEKHALKLFQATETDSVESTAQSYLETHANAFAEQVVERWWTFAWTLVAKYSDGFVTTGEQPEQMQSPGYPAWWLQLSEFSKWPGDSFTPKDSIRKQLVVDSGVGLFVQQPSAVIKEQGIHESSQFSYWALVGSVAAGAVLGAGALALSQRHFRHRGYLTLE